MADCKRGACQTKILVVDDDITVRLILRHMLEREGYEILEAENGAQAVELFAQAKPDLVLLDVMMPKLDGFQACAQLRQAPDGETVSIVMITCLNDDESVDKAFAAGADDYVTKPIHRTILRQRLRRILANKRAQESIRLQAFHDGLTSLPNRHFFYERLQTAIAAADIARYQLAVLFLDLDRFKLINDTFGHGIGDLLLKRVAQRILQSIPPEATAARIGGDEFTILLPRIEDEEEAEAVARQILGAFEEPFVFDQVHISSSTSIGIALYPQDGYDRDTLMANADVAMYRAKEKGRNTYQLSTSLVPA